MTDTLALVELTPEQRFARDICESLPDGPGCCMSEDGKEPCNDQSCAVYPIAVRAYRFLQCELREARGLIKEMRGDDKQPGWMDRLDSHYYGTEQADFSKRLDAFLTRTAIQEITTVGQLQEALEAKEAERLKRLQIEHERDVLVEELARLSQALEAR